MGEPTDLYEAIALGEAKIREQFAFLENATSGDFHEVEIKKHPRHVTGEVGYRNGVMYIEVIYSPGEAALGATYGGLRIVLAKMRDGEIPFDARWSSGKDSLWVDFLSLVELNDGKSALNTLYEGHDLSRNYETAVSFHAALLRSYGLGTGDRGLLTSEPARFDKIFEKLVAIMLERSRALLARFPDSDVHL